MPRAWRRRLVAISLTVGLLPAGAPARAGAPDPVGAVSQTRIEASVAALFGRRASTEERAAAADWIEAELASYGYPTARRGGPYLTNVVATLSGTERPNEVVVVGAHYDTVWTSPGADDDASGIAGMLEIARVLAGSPQSATILFVAFDLEESGYEGSWAYSYELEAQQRTVLGMVSLEMIGYRCEEPFCQFPFGNLGTCFQVSTVGVNVGTFIALVANGASERLLDTFVAGAAARVPSLRVEWAKVRDDGSCFPATRRSDHAAFWDRGFPAMMLTDTAEYRNKSYHTEADTIDTLDFAFATDVTRATTAWAIALASPAPEPDAAATASFAGAMLAALARRRRVRPAPASAPRADRP